MQDSLPDPSSRAPSVVEGEILHLHLFSLHNATTCFDQDRWCSVNILSLRCKHNSPFFETAISIQTLASKSSPGWRSLLKVTPFEVLQPVSSAFANDTPPRLFPPVALQGIRYCVGCRHGLQHLWWWPH